MKCLRCLITNTRLPLIPYCTWPRQVDITEQANFSSLIENRVQLRGFFDMRKRKARKLELRNVEGRSSVGRASDL